ncbi:MAG: VWA containing CoxE family protein, partial [Myxococcota bacterium]
MGQDHRNRRQLVLWYAVANAIGCDVDTNRAAKMIRQMAAEYDLPALLLDPRPSLQQIVRRHPELEQELLEVLPKEEEPASAEEGEEEPPIDEASVRRALLFSKMLVNVFGTQGGGTVTAQQLAEWQSDVKFFQRSMAHGSGGRSGQSRSLYEPGDDMQDPGAGYDWKAPGSGGAPDVEHDDVQYALDEIRSGRGLMNAPEIKAALDRTERNMINRMALREILKDRDLVEKMTPSMALTEQLLRDKDNLEGPALKHAKILIHRFIRDLSDLIKRDVQSTSRGKVDHNVPPKRTFANLDLKRTIWKNLTNWNPDEERLYVDRLYYRRRAQRTND